MLPSHEQVANPGVQISPRRATSLSNNGPGTKRWVRPRGPKQRPKNYLSIGNPPVRPKLFRGGETEHFFRMHDENGELVGVAAPHVADSALIDCHQAFPVSKNMVYGFFNAMLTDTEVKGFERENPISASEVAELINLFDDDHHPANADGNATRGSLTRAQLDTSFKKYRHFDPDYLLRERKLMFRLRERVLLSSLGGALTVQQWFDSIGSKGNKLRAAKEREDESSSSGGSSRRSSVATQGDENVTGGGGGRRGTGGGGGSIRLSSSSSHAGSNPNTGRSDGERRTSRNATAGGEGGLTSSWGLHPEDATPLALHSRPHVPPLVSPLPLPPLLSSASSEDNTASTTTTTATSSTSSAAASSPSSPPSSSSSSSASVEVGDTSGGVGKTGVGATSSASGGEDKMDDTGSIDDSDGGAFDEEFYYDEEDTAGGNVGSDDASSEERNQKVKGGDDDDNGSGDGDDDHGKSSDDSNSNSNSNSNTGSSNTNSGMASSGMTGSAVKSVLDAMLSAVVAAAETAAPAGGSDQAAAVRRAYEAHRRRQSSHSDDASTTSSHKTQDTTATGDTKTTNGGAGSKSRSTAAAAAVPQWGSAFAKGEDHVERVGMTEFRKSVASLLGPGFAFTPAEEKLFFKYMGEVQFNAYAPAEVPVKQVESALKHADRVHLEARMSVVLRKLDRLLRFNGLGLEDFFPARMPEGAGGYTAAGRARVSPIVVHKAKDLVRELTRLVEGKHETLLKVKRRPHWVTFYWTLEPDPLLGRPPPSPSHPSPAGSNSLPRANPQARSQGVRASQAQTPLAEKERGVSTTVAAEGQQQQQQQQQRQEGGEEEEGGQDTGRSLKSLPATAAAAEDKGAVFAALSARSTSSSSYGTLTDRTDRTAHEDGNSTARTTQGNKRGGSAAGSADGSVLSLRAREAQAAREQEEAVRAADRAQGLERTGTLRKFGCCVELVEERNGWPWERVCVDRDAFQTIDIKVPRQGWTSAGADPLPAWMVAPSNESLPLPVATSGNPWDVPTVRSSSRVGSNGSNRSGGSLGGGQAARSAPGRGDDGGGDDDGLLRKLTLKSLMCDDESSDGGGSGAAPTTKKEMPTTKKKDMLTMPGRTWSLAVVPSALHDHKAAAKNNDNNAPLQSPLAAEAAAAAAAAGAAPANSGNIFPSAGGAQTSGDSSETSTSTSTSSSLAAADRLSWNARQATLGAGVPGFHFRLSHPTMRVDGWCRTAYDINRFVGGFTAQAKIPLTLDSERLPPPELTAQDLEMGFLQGWVDEEDEEKQEENEEEHEEEKEAGGGIRIPDSSSGFPSLSLPASSEVNHSQTMVAAMATTVSSDATATNNNDTATVKAPPPPPSPPPPKEKRNFQFAPSSGATVYFRNTHSENANNPFNGGRKGNGSNPALQAMACGKRQGAQGGQGFETNASRRRVCCFCGQGDPKEEALKAEVHADVSRALEAQSFVQKEEARQRQLQLQQQQHALLVLRDKEEAMASPQSRGGGERQQKKGGEKQPRRRQTKAEASASAATGGEGGRVKRGSSSCRGSDGSVSSAVLASAGKRVMTLNVATRRSSRASSIASNSSAAGGSSVKSTGTKKHPQTTQARTSVSVFAASAATAPGPPLQPPPRAAIKWGLKPREIFIACPFGLVSDLSCWPCLAANARSSHAEQQANVTVPLRAHAAHYHTSEAVSGWTHAAPASIAEATKQAARTAEATTLWGYRTAYKVDEASVGAVKAQAKEAQDAQSDLERQANRRALTPAHLKSRVVKTADAALESAERRLKNSGGSAQGGSGGGASAKAVSGQRRQRGPDPYDPHEASSAAAAASAAAALSAAEAAASQSEQRRKPRKAESVKAEDEEGWVLEATDGACLSSRHALDRRLRWVTDTLERIAPLVKAQFRRALVQDEELKRRKKCLELRIAEQVEILGGVGTGMIRGEAFIPAVPTVSELESARKQTEQSLKQAMARRLYSKVTSLEEQLVAIKARQLTIFDEIAAGEASEEAERLEKLKQRPRAQWDRVEGQFRHAPPLLFSLTQKEAGRVLTLAAAAAAAAAASREEEKEKGSAQEEEEGARRRGREAAMATTATISAAMVGGEASDGLATTAAITTMAIGGGSFATTTAAVTSDDTDKNAPVAITAAATAPGGKGGEVTSTTMAATFRKTGSAQQQQAEF